MMKTSDGNQLDGTAPKIHAASPDSQQQGPWLSQTDAKMRAFDA